MTGPIYGKKTYARNINPHILEEVLSLVQISPILKYALRSI